MKKLIFLLCLPLFLSAQNYKDKIVMQSGKSFLCEIVELEGNNLKIEFSDKRQSKVVLSVIKSITVYPHKLVYTSVDHFLILKDNFKDLLRNRREKTAPTSFSGINDSLTNELVKIQLGGGTVIIGKIVSENDSTIMIKTTSGFETTVPRAQIKERENLTGKIVKDEIWHDDPNKTRLLFSPTGRALEKGKGYFAVYEVFFPFLSFGITDIITLSGGMSLFPGADEQLLYFAPKITLVQQEKFDFSTGVLYMKIPEEGKGAGILYGVGTYGEESAAVTIGMGYGFSGGDFADNPMLVLGGEFRTSRSIKLLTENWIIFGSDINLLSVGLRFFGESLSADFGFMRPTVSDAGFVPWLGFAYNY